MKATKHLRALFNDRFLKTDFLPKIEDFDATDEEKLNTLLADGTEWIVVLPSWLNPKYMSATWLIAHGLAIPYSFWKHSTIYRVYVFANAWREMFSDGCPFFVANNTKAWTRRLYHPEQSMLGFKIFRWKAASQKANILSKMRRVYLEALEEAGSMSSVDTVNSMHQGVNCSLDYRALPASADAIEKSLLFIGSQLNWIRNPAFNRDSISTSLTYADGRDEHREEFQAVKAQYYRTDIVYADLKSIAQLLEVTNADQLETNMHLALPIINYYAGTQLFAWSYLYSECLAALPDPGSNGSMGDIANNVFMVLKEGSFLAKCGVSTAPTWEQEIKNEIQALHAVTGFTLYPYGSNPVNEYSNIKFAHTWLGQVSSRALYMALNMRTYKYDNKRIIKVNELSNTGAYKNVLDYMDSSNFNKRGSNPLSASFTDLPEAYFPNLMNPAHGHYTINNLKPKKG